METTAINTNLSKATIDSAKMQANNSHVKILHCKDDNACETLRVIRSCIGSCAKETNVKKMRTENSKTMPIAFSQDYLHWWYLKFWFCYCLEQENVTVVEGNH